MDCSGANAVQSCNGATFVWAEGEKRISSFSKKTINNKREKTTLDPRKF